MPGVASVTSELTDEDWLSERKFVEELLVHIGMEGGIVFPAGLPPHASTVTVSDEHHLQADVRLTGTTERTSTS